VIDHVDLQFRAASASLRASRISTSLSNDHPKMVALCGGAIYVQYAGEVQAREPFIKAA